MNDEKMAETLVFFPEENNKCLPNFEVFNEKEFLKTSNDLDDSEISLFIEENRNVNTTIKTKTNLKSVKETRAFEEIPAEKLNNLLCHLFMSSFLRSCLQQMHNRYQS